MKQSNFIQRVIVLLTIAILSACSPISIDGPYRGRVIDAETRQPIENVVVLGVWYSESSTVGGVVGKYYDARETMTDKKGEFEISGQGLRLFSNLSEMHVLIFKAGYEYIGPGPWRSFKIAESYKKSIAWEGDRAIIPLQKLTMEERKQRIISRPNIPDERMRTLTREIDKERIYKGLPPFEGVE